MNVRRGEVVIVDFPYSDQTASKIRPALIVQADLWHQRLDDTILAPITSSNNRGRIMPTQYFVDISTDEGQRTGLTLNSVVRCGSLITYNRSLILGIIGRLPPPAMQQIDICLKAALGIS